MRRALRVLTILASFWLAARPAHADVTLALDVENLHTDTVLSLCPSGATVLLLVSTTNSSFGDLSFSNNPALADSQFTAEPDDQVLGMFGVTPDGVFQNVITFNIANGVSPNDPLLLVWYPNLTFNPSRFGPGKGQLFGTYRSDAATMFSDIGWKVPADGSLFNLVANTVSTGADVPDASLVATQFTAGQANHPPTALCQDVTKAADTNCLAAVTEAEVDNGSSDPDGDPIALSLSSTGPFGLGTHNVTLTVTDNQGGTNTCTATVTVVDSTPPLITCPSNISTQIPPAQVSVVINYPAPVASDACSSVNVISVPPSGSSFPLGTNTVTCTATDGAGNTNSCSFKIIVVEQTANNAPPNALCHDVTKAAGANCQASVSPAEVDAGSSDPDADPITLALDSTGPFSAGTTNTVTLTVADNRGGTNSCTATVIVVDSTPPVMTCPGNLVTNVAPGVTSAVVTFPLPVATDNCSTPNVVSVPASGSSFPVGTNLVTCTATDAANNQRACTFFVIVNTMPVALCRDVTKLAATNCAVAVAAAEVDNGSFDPDGDPVTLGLSSAGPFDVGTNAVTLIVADNRGGTNSCSAQVIVVDDMPPDIACPSNISTQVLPGVSSVVVNFPPPAVSDNCSIASVVFVPPSGTPFPLGTNAVVCTATDASGNTNSCAFDVVVGTSDTNVYDLAAVSLHRPRTVRLSAGHPNVTGLVKVTIKNLSPRPETITNFTGLVDLQVLALTNCPNLTATLLDRPPQRTLPVTLKPQKKLTVYFNVTFGVGCIPDLRRNSGHIHFDDYLYVASVHHEAIDGNPDTNPSNDALPVSGEVLTDVYVWFW